MKKRTPMRGSACSRALVALLCLLTLLLPPGSHADTFKNPLFSSQDPWVTFVGGCYYYSDSNGTGIYIRKSRTLTGLAQAQPVRVFSPTAASHNKELWAPEIHFIQGHWYLYYCADNGQNANHRLYVAEANTDDPQGRYTDKGQLVEPSNDWAIDPDVFEAGGRLYIVWSGTENQTGAFPQNLYIAAMSDPLHISGSKHMISTPTEAWEKRTAPINEGPIGFERRGRTYITYSASASWTTDYADGLLLNRDGNLLAPDSWAKTGPIFDHHGTAYGPGSVVFAPSPDGTETWNLYHGIDSPKCRPSYACRDLRLQKLTWDNDLPLLGYPVNPGVPLDLPSGDEGTFGWGASAPGTPVSGTWTYESAAGAAGMSLGPGRHQTFRGDARLFDYTVQAAAQWVESWSASTSPRYGIYALYCDSGNSVAAFIDPLKRVYATEAVVAGVAQGRQDTPLPAGFDPARFHTIRVGKVDRLFRFSLDGELMQQRTFELSSGRIGLMTEDTKANFQGVSVTDDSQGWGNAFGDAAEGATEGRKTGDWMIVSPSAAGSASLGAGWKTLFRGNPNLQYYTVSTDVQWVQSGSNSSSPRYGIYACYNDAGNNVVALLDLKRRTYSTHAVVGSVAQDWQDTPLPEPFDPNSVHNITVVKAGSAFTFSLDSKPMQQRTFDLLNGQIGLVTDDTKANFQHVSVTRQPVP